MYNTKILNTPPPCSICLTHRLLQLIDSDIETSDYVCGELHQCEMGHVELILIMEQAKTGLVICRLYYIRLENVKLILHIDIEICIGLVGVNNTLSSAFVILVP